MTAWLPFAVALALAAQPASEPVNATGSAVAAEGWRTVNYPGGGVLRYLLPKMTHADYPRGALDAGIEGRTLLRLEVDPQGRIVDCRAAQSAGPTLDARACEAYRARARFELRGIDHNIVLHAPVQWQLEQIADDAEWPDGRPAELLQAKGCVGEPPQPGGNELRAGGLVSVDTLPACLQASLTAVAQRAVEIAGDARAKVVLRARVGRAFAEASLFHALPKSDVVHQPADIALVMDMLSREWVDYVSPDGELGWSGFLLVVEKGRTRVRMLARDPSPDDIMLHSDRIRDEFFRGMLFEDERGS